ncbi:MAG: choline monooxygenase [Euryarchaeota archaeon]|nr:choline monooxygenase [Euryarchaeota archaeon]
MGYPVISRLFITRLSTCNMARDYVDEDISLAQTLHSDYYTDTELFERIKESFLNHWHFAVHSSEFDSVNIIPLERMGDLINDEVILTKDENYACISNVCTHRAMLLVEEKCKKSRIQCPYHGRSFDLQGQFKNMPKFENVKNFPTQKDNLKKFKLMNWKNLLFVNKGEQNFDEFIEFLDNRIGWMDIEKFKYDSSKDRTYSVKANWALYVDNYLEGFHIPFVHGDLNNIIENDTYETELFSNGVLQIGFAKPGELCFNLPKESIDYGKNIAAYYFWLYPNMMFNFYPWGLSVNIVVPLNSDKSKIIYRGYIGNKDLILEGAGGDLDKVEEEDQQIVEGVQRGVASKSYERGRYSPEKETGVHHFHRLLLENLD